MWIGDGETNELRNANLKGCVMGCDAMRCYATRCDAMRYHHGTIRPQTMRHECTRARTRTAYLEHQIVLCSR
jgi:hypothetical protein